MMKFLRSQSQTVLVIVLGVIGLGFLFYGNAGNLLTTGSGHVSNDFGSIDGQDLSVAELYDAIRTTRDTLALHGEAQKLTTAQLAEQAWNQLLLLREADRLHINISDKELVDYIQGLPIFQKDGVYSPEVYESRIKEVGTLLRVPADGSVDSLANTKAIFETLMRNDLRTQAVSKALFSGVRSSAHDVSAQYDKFYGPVTVSVATIDPKSFLSSVQVSPAEIESEYKAHPENPAYRTEEKRKVDYVLFLLSPDQVKLPDAQKTTAKDALGQKALNFAEAFIPDPTASPNGAGTPPPDFMSEAQKQGLTPATTDFFSADATPANVPPSPAFNSAAFSLTKDNPISKVVELDNGVAVLHLDEIQASELRPLEEVKADIQKQLQQSKSMQAAQFNAQFLGQLLKSAVAKGSDFKTAASGMKLKVETLPAFVPIKAPPTDQRLQTIAYATTSLKPGEISKPTPVEADKTILLIHLDSRAPADAAGLADFETRFRTSQDQQLEGLVYDDWANWKSKQPGTHKPPNLEAYGSVE